jgi:hypothetical protein
VDQTVVPRFRCITTYGMSCHKHLLLFLNKLII